MKGDSQAMMLDDDDDDGALTFLDKPGMVKMHMCMECGSVFTKPSHLRQHELSHQGKSFMCDVEGCEKMYTRKDHLTRHMKMEHSSSLAAAQSTPFTCALCRQDFKYKHGLTRHMKDKHDASNAAYMCATCQQTFKKKSLLQQHSYVHTGDAPFPCAHCDAAFLKKFQLDAHTRRFHTPAVSVLMEFGNDVKGRLLVEQVPVECPICHQFLASNKTLQSHIQAVHGHPPKTVACPDCGNEYSTRANLNKHRRVAHATTTTTSTYSCELCHRSFHYKHVLRRHMDAIHGTPRNPETPKPRKRKELDHDAIRAKLLGT
ncbi:hypothetical protein DYB26_005004 [Aphanomyces astaci]|uniref:C2H2-type domain-containing protein n=1 Tax=Aphanomyces astaci TaxID=112090 RepID=A0A397DP74_APHAT|nr:hypothetical protein DYB38_008254 [Aphanomyces astaci]RHZ32710.1 hypothetical protein DYB26_005004 [Aphanomyces astaci]